jgi:ATP-dependent DNA ligase
MAFQISMHDLIEWQGDDLRNYKLIDRKQRLAKMLTRGGAAIQFNEHMAHVRFVTLTKLPWQFVVSQF